jgi:hypothetical protein
MNSTNETLIQRAREQASSLFATYVDVKPENFDFGSAGYDDKGELVWDFMEAVECQECGRMIVENEHLPHCSRDGDDYREFDQAEGPMMNYRYPIGDSDYSPENAHKIADLPLCLVETPDANYLALTGGGMDLSWEICEAYCRLGYLPPAHFELPAMAGKVLNERTAFVVAAVERSNQLLAGWADRRRERAAAMFTELEVAK